ncbi:MAG: prephenate dehydratase [Deltaproteobacteria bacterium]|jgi:chorismate mutase/prephenate dehydratase|nr:prephenate dehydratase [Deltaproteobacteria bacterium]
MKVDRLKKLREALGKKDQEILRLLNERGCLSLEVGRVKSRKGQEVYDPSQEAKVLAQLTGKNAGPLPEQAIRNIYREIISSSRALQGPISVAYLGPEASFTHQAALAHFGRDASYIPKPAMADIFRDVEREIIPWGVVPIENSLEGSVRQTQSQLIATSAGIRAEIFLQITLCLLASQQRREKIKRIYSHPHALGQCREWLRKNLPNCRQIESGSTAEAAGKALEDREGAAVASRIAATTYGLFILDEGIEDYPENATRFLVIGKGASKPTGQDKTSVLFATPHVPGALHQALTPFSRAKVNLMRIESHPLRERKWEYLFFVDFEGHAEEKKTAKVLREMKVRTTFLKNLGSYPQGGQA